MISILYPLGPGSAWNNSELRFSLRSLEFIINDLESVFVVGSNPGFLSEQVTHIPTYHNFPNPARGIFENLLAACQDERTPERFALMNDDYFFCSEVELYNYAFYHLGPISDTLKRCSSEYYNHLFTTQNELLKRGLPTINWDGHFPMLVEKSKVLELAEIYDWDRMHGLTFKSTYCNTFGISGEFRQDCKVNAPHGLEWWLGYVSERECFSIGDMALNGGGLIEFLQKVYSEKCIFEI